MKLFSALLVTLLVSSSAFAQRGTVRSNNDFSSSSSNASATAYVGFGQGAINIGGDFESAMNSDTAIGGYFYLLTDKKDSGVYFKPQLITFGGHAKVHYRTGDWDLYGSPGFGLMLVEHNNARTNADDDTTTIGPSMRIGVLYSVTPQLALGLEHATFFNWLADDIGGGEMQSANLAARMNF